MGSSDVDAKTQLVKDKTTNDKFNQLEIPMGCKYSMCGMNVAWNPNVTKYMYFGLQGKNYPVDRCGDIWAGFYCSKKCDENRLAHVSGYAPVMHNRASNAWANLEKERNADEMTDIFCAWIEDDPYCLENQPDEFVEYFEKLDIAYSLWEKHCEKRQNKNTKSNEE
jgi:hypothetical protein